MNFSGISGLTVKIITEKELKEGKQLIDNIDNIDIEEIDISIVGIIEKATSKGNTGLVFCFQHEGENRWYMGSMTSGLFDMLTHAVKGANERFKNQ